MVKKASEQLAERKEKKAERKVEIAEKNMKKAKGIPDNVTIEERLMDVQKALDNYTKDSFEASQHLKLCADTVVYLSIKGHYHMLVKMAEEAGDHAAKLFNAANAVIEKHHEQKELENLLELKTNPEKKGETDAQKADQQTPQGEV
jgi:hypothetical protein